jgi:hypothetical protein
MTKIANTLHLIRTNWTSPASAVHKGQVIPFKLASYINAQGANASVLAASRFPEGIKEFWSLCENAILFRDAEYGQWGLEIFSPDEALHQTKLNKQIRMRDFDGGDTIIGRFIGDSDLLVLASDEKVIVALPIDRRTDWPIVADNFSDFLEKYVNAQGEKYWEN